MRASLRTISANLHPIPDSGGARPTCAAPTARPDRPTSSGPKRRSGPPSVSGSRTTPPKSDARPAGGTITTAPSTFETFKRRKSPPRWRRSLITSRRPFASTAQRRRVPSSPLSPGYYPWSSAATFPTPRCASNYLAQLTELLHEAELEQLRDNGIPPRVVPAPLPTEELNRGGYGRGHRLAIQPPLVRLSCYWLMNYYSTQRAVPISQLLVATSSPGAGSPAFCCSHLPHVLL